MFKHLKCIGKIHNISRRIYIFRSSEKIFVMGVMNFKNSISKAFQAKLQNKIMPSTKVYQFKSNRW